MKTSELPIPNLGLLEIFLIQVVLYAILWLVSDYTATLLTIVLPLIFFCLLMLALLSELVQRSKISSWYYWFMGISIIAPIITATIFVFILGVDFDWTKL